MKIQASVSQRARCMSMSRKGGAGRFRTHFVRDGHGNRHENLLDEVVGYGGL